MKTIVATLLLAGVSLLVHCETVWESPLRDREELKAWTPYRGLSVGPEGLWLTNSDPAAGTHGTRRNLDAAALRGRLIRLSGERAGKEIAAGEKEYLGPKIQFAGTRKSGPFYLEVPGKFGTYDWTPFEQVVSIPADAEKLHLFLGFQNGVGTMGIRSLKLETLGVPLDFAPCANMGWKDDEAGNGKGGWSDQGPGMDGRGFLWPRLYQEKVFANVPFEVLTKGNAVLTMYSSHFPNGLKQVTLPLPEPVPAKELYLLHTLCWGPREQDAAVGAAVVEYEDGTSERIPVRANRDVADWWQQDIQPNGAPGVRGRSNDGDWRTLYVSRFPLKGGRVKSVQFEAENPATLWIICAATLSEKAYELPRPAKAEQTTVAAGPEWLPVAREDFNRRTAGSALDLSKLTDRAPAGTQGRVIVRPDGHFAFEKQPDRIVRFFTASISFKLDSRWQIDQLADELVKNGYNMVRLHIPENTLMHGSGKTLEFNTHYQDLFDYLAAALKKRGIYMMCDMAGSVVYGWEPFPTNYWGGAQPDASRRRNRLAVHFDPEARARWRQGAKQLLCRINPYTETRLADDPVMVMVMGYNEQEFEFSRKFDTEFVAPYYRAFLKRKYGSVEAYNRKHGTNVSGFDAIPCFASRESGGDDVREFLYETERNTAQWYRDQLRELGYRGLTASYNVFKTHHFNRIRNESCDYIGINHYHAHPSNWVEPGSEISQESAIARASNLIRDIVSARLHGKPLAVTEYQCVYWNRYRYEQPFVFGAYAALQGLDAITMHAEPVSLTPMGGGNSRITSFNGYKDPITVASEFLTFFLYLRGDVRTTPDDVRVLLPKENAGIPDWNVTLAKTQNSLALLHGFSTTYDPEAAAKAVSFTLSGSSQTAGTEAFSQSIDESANLVPYLKVLKEKGILPETNRSNGVSVFESSTGELLLDADKRFMQINTPRFQGICGEAGTKWKLDDFEVESMSARGNLSLVSVDGTRPIRDAERLVLVYATNALSNGITFADSEMRKLINGGRGPALLQRGAFRVRVRNRNATALKLYPLDLAGNRLKEIRPGKIDGEYAVFEADTGKDGAAVFFEIASK